MLEKFIDPILQLIHRVQGYPWHVVAIELLVIGSVVFLTLRHLRGTRGARVIKGVLLILIPATITIQAVGGEVFERLSTLYSNFLEVLTIGLIVVFQPELRRALVRLGEFRPPWVAAPRRAKVIEEIITSVEYLSRNKIGALIALEREEGLRGLVEAGTHIDGLVSRRVLNTIFWPGSALHDMGVVIRGDRIVAAGVQFPLAEGDPLTQDLGSRHRAAIGLSLESDVLVIVVSEETGIVSLAERGLLHRELDSEMLRSRLTRGLGRIEIASGVDESEIASRGPD